MNQKEAAANGRKNLETPSTLGQKIEGLFTYRMFPYLFDQIDKPEENKQFFYKQLFSLQESIYSLDALLESNWIVDRVARDHKWSEVRDSLHPFKKEGEALETCLRHIVKYEKHELGIRHGILPLTYKMSYFYFYKSCDVKLLRRLLYEYGRLEGKVGKQSSWKLFDMVTEINDDISDVWEDLEFFNGNRFLIRLLLSGKQGAKQEFFGFLQELIQLIKSKPVSKGQAGMEDVIREESLVQANRTLILLEESLDTISVEELKEKSVLYSKIKHASTSSRVFI